MYAGTWRGFDYSFRTTDELHAFIKTRGIPGDDELLASRWRCEMVLAQADNDATFRFLDLLPELRNRVYSYLFPTARQRAKGDTQSWPAILSTCKQVHNEATDLLHDFVVTFRTKLVTHTLGFQTIPHWDELIELNGTPVAKGDTWSSVAQVQLWPTQILKPRKLKIIVDLSPSGPKLASDFVVLNHAMYDLYCFALNKAKWTKVQVEVIRNGAEHDTSLHAFLSPLGLISAVKTITTKGVSDDIKTQLATVPDHTSMTGVHLDPVRLYRQLGKQTKTFQQVQYALNSNDPSLSKSYVFHHNHMAVDLVWNPFQGSQLFTPERDRLFRRRLNALDKELERLTMKLRKKLSPVMASLDKLVRDRAEQT